MVYDKPYKHLTEQQVKVVNETVDNLGYTVSKVNLTILEKMMNDSYNTDKWELSYEDIYYIFLENALTKTLQEGCYRTGDSIEEMVRYIEENVSAMKKYDIFNELEEYKYSVRLVIKTVSLVR